MMSKKLSIIAVSIVLAYISGSSVANLLLDRKKSMVSASSSSEAIGQVYGKSATSRFRFEPLFLNHNPEQRHEISL